MAGLDVDDELKKDAERIRKLRSRDESFSVPLAIEYTLWTLAVLSAVLMVLVMPWVGEGKPIPGTMWLGLSLLAICLFAGLAMLLHLAFGDIGSAAGSAIRERTEGGR